MGPPRDRPASKLNLNQHLWTKVLGGKLLPDRKKRETWVWKRKITNPWHLAEKAYNSPLIRFNACHQRQRQEERQKRGWTGRMVILEGEGRKQRRTWLLSLHWSITILSKEIQTEGKGPICSENFLQANHWKMLCSENYSFLQQEA